MFNLRCCWWSVGRQRCHPHVKLALQHQVLNDKCKWVEKGHLLRCIQPVMNSHPELQVLITFHLAFPNLRHFHIRINYLSNRLSWTTQADARPTRRKRPDYSRMAPNQSAAPASTQQRGPQNDRTGPPIEYNGFGPCRCVYSHCHARFWYEEILSASTGYSGLYNI